MSIKTLVIAEISHGQLSRATRCAITAAAQIGGQIDLLMLANDAALAQQAITISGITKIIISQAEQFSYPLAEHAAPMIASHAADYTHLVVAATSWGKDLMPRVAALLNVGQISEVLQVHGADIFTHAIYAGNALEKVQSLESIHCLTIRPTAFAPATADASRAPAPIEISNVTAVFEAHSQFLGVEEGHCSRPELTAAPIVVSGGRGVGTKDGFARLGQFADQIGAALGASRAAVDAGLVGNELQVGQTGKVVAPELYIAVGISGAIQHVAGMKDSKHIVAINTDERAPIFEVADVCWVADWKEAVEALSQCWPRS